MPNLSVFIFTRISRKFRAYNNKQLQAYTNRMEFDRLVHDWSSGQIVFFANDTLGFGKKAYDFILKFSVCLLPTNSVYVYTFV